MFIQQLNIGEIMFRKEQEEDDFRKRREEYAIGIRRTTREETFNKRRNMGMGLLTAQDGSNSQEVDNIVDDRYRKELQEMIDFEYDNSMFEKLVSLTFGADVLEMHRGIIGLRKLLASNEEAPVQEFIDRGLIQKSFQFINQKEFPQLKLEAVWALTNVASGETQYCAKLVEKGAIQRFVALLIENQKGVVDQAIWALGNIAADQTIYRDRILKAGGMNALISIIENTSNKTIIKNGIWAMTNLCRGSPNPTYDLVKNATEVLAKALISGIIVSKEIISDCCWSISYMCEGPKSRIERVMNTGALPVFFKYAKDSYSGLYIPSLRIIGNFSTGNELQTEQLLKNGIFDLLKYLLKHPKTVIRKEACWIASNIAAGTASQVLQLMNDRQLIKCFVEAFQTDVVQVKRQICWIFSNFGHLGPKKEAIRIYLQYDIMRHFINLLNTKDTLTLDPTLECLYKILIIGMKGAENGNNLMLQQMLQLNGAEILQQLQYHDSMKVYERSVKILSKFFVVDEGNQLM